MRVSQRRWFVARHSLDSSLVKAILARAGLGMNGADFTTLVLRNLEQTATACT